MSLCSSPAFAALEARFIEAGRRAGEILRRDARERNKRYRALLAHNVIAGLVTLDTYMLGLRTSQDEKNVRFVRRYLRMRAASLQIKKAA